MSVRVLGGKEVVEVLRPPGARRAVGLAEPACECGPGCSQGGCGGEQEAVIRGGRSQKNPRDKRRNGRTPQGERTAKQVAGLLNLAEWSNGVPVHGLAAPGAVRGPSLGTEGPVSSSYSGCSAHLPGEEVVGSTTDRDIVVHGRSVLPESKDTDAIDASMTQFMRNFEIPNGALAVVSPNGRLVYAKGFTNLLAYDLARVEPYYATAQTRFRIGGLSKVLTGLSAIQVFQELRLHPEGLNARVGEVVDLTTTPYLLEYVGAVWPVDPRLQDIRVRDLLTHSAGWFSGVPENTENANDVDGIWPAFRWADRADLSPQYDPTSYDKAASIAAASRATYPITADHLLRVGNLPPLSWDPGTYYAYNNYGYWLAGQAIAGVTCRSYASVVSELLLRPLGMEDTHVGDVERGLRQVGEVPYFAELWPWEAGASTDVVYQSANFDGSYSAPDLPPEYGPYAERQIRLCAASGGWVSTVADLARVARELFGGAPTVLNGASVTTARLRALPTSATGYATLCGLGVDSGNEELEKSGHMESTMAWLYNFGQRSVGASGATVIYLFNRNTSTLENGGEGTLRTALTGPIPSAPGAVTVITDWGADDMFTS